MSIKRLVVALDALGIEASSREIAEAVWLARQIGPPPPQVPVVDEGAEPVQSMDQGVVSPKRRIPVVPAAPVAPPPESRASLHPQVSRAAEGDRPGGLNAVGARAPAVTALPRGLDLIRVLRPLKRRVPSPHDLTLDEDATADLMAEQGLVLPVLRPSLDRWLSLAIVVDSGTSMVIWRPLVAELRTLLERLGAFRDIRVWHLHKGLAGELGLHPRAVPKGALHSPRELVDPSGRQAVLVVSDCVDGKWRKGKVDPLLRTWGHRGPLAILQPLPQRLWKRSGLDPIPATIHATTPGVPNPQLVVNPHLWLPDGAPLDGMPVPILEIDPSWLSAWAQLVAGTAYGGINGIVTLTGSRSARPPADRRTRLGTPREQVVRFRAGASPAAFRLAGYLSAAPLTLPIMRLVQRVMLPDSKPSHLAEVFVSGLIFRTDEAIADPEHFEYRWNDGVREELLGTVRHSEAVEVVEQINDFVASRMGQTRDTAVLLEVPAGRGDRALPSSSTPFASIPTQVLERLGGRFAQVAEQRMVPPAQSKAEKTPAPPSGEHVDTVVVGSGFGGSVAAYNLAAAGLSVVVLERGQAWPPGSFPRSPAEMGRSFWDPKEGMYGLFDVLRFRGFDSLIASGLGGGSLIYANVLLRKDERWFVREQPLPGGGYESWPVTRADLDPHYDAVERMLGATPYPLDRAPFAETPKTIAMQDAAAELGLEWFRPPLAISFAPSPEADPALGLPILDPDYGNLHGAPRRTCRLCGECNIGCNDGSKNTLDFTYLSAAKHHGADLRTSNEVKAIRPRPGGGYEVDYLHRDATELRTIGCNRLVLAAGTYGTTQLLLQGRERFPGISPALGTRFNGNGDLLTFLTRLQDRHSVRPLDAGRGPVVTSAIRLADSLDGDSAAGRGGYIEDAGYPGFVDWLVDAGDLSRGVARGTRSVVERFLSTASRRAEDTLSGALAEMASSDLLGLGSLPLFGMGREVPDGVLRLRGGGLSATFNSDASRSYFARLRTTMLKMADVLGADFADNPAGANSRFMVLDPLGGAPMAERPEEGVCDPYGEVFGYPGLYIADGAALPGSVGPNPALTIAALADRMCTRLLERGGRTKGLTASPPAW